MSTLDETIKDLNKKYSGAIMNAGEKDSEKIKIDFISTGCFSLDRVFGCGGLPRGRMIEIYGEESTGKSTVALHIVSVVQKNKGKAVWLDAEYSFSDVYAKAIGVDVSKLIIVQPETGEEALDTIAKLASTGEVDLIVLDSVAALIPKKERDGEITDESMALAARMMAKGMRMLTATLSKTNTAVIFVNQIRDKVGLVFGKKSTTPGGKALKFFASVRLEVHRGERILDKNKDVIGNWMKVCCVKNKVGLPFRVAEFELYYAHGIDIEGDTLNEGERLGIITKSGFSYIFKDTKLGVGRDQAKKFLVDNPDTFKLLSNEIKSYEEKEKLSFTK